MLRAAHQTRPWRATRVLDRYGVSSITELATRFSPGDLLVLNDAATVPASLHGQVAGRSVELRLVPAIGAPFSSARKAVLFGAGDWRQDTDTREPPPALAIGDRIRIADVSIEVLQIDSRSPRLVTLRFPFEGDSFAAFLYREARVVQYQHLTSALALEDVQTPYGGPAWSVEMPSTGRPITFEVLDQIRARGAKVAWLTHAAGLSATGDPALDQMLPFPERYLVRKETVRAIRSARRVIAVGTTSARALEAAQDAIRTGPASTIEGVARNKIGPSTPLAIVDAILTGVHSPGESHYELLGAFVNEEELARMHRVAEESGLRAHEFGDLMLVARERPTRPTLARPRRRSP